MRKFTAFTVVVLIVSLGICCWNLPVSSAKAPESITESHACCAESPGSTPTLFHHATVCKVETATLQSSSSSQKTPATSAVFEFPTHLTISPPFSIFSINRLPVNPPDFVVTHCHFIS